MRYFITILLILLYNIGSTTEYDLNLYMKQEAYERRQQEKLFNVSSNEQTDMATTKALVDIGGIDNFPYYPIIRLDFFYIFNPSYYKDRKFTHVMDKVSIRDNTVLGVRLRMSIGYNK